MGARYLVVQDAKPGPQLLPFKPRRYGLCGMPPYSAAWDIIGVKVAHG